MLIARNLQWRSRVGQAQTCSPNRRRPCAQGAAGANRWGGMARPNPVLLSGLLLSVLWGSIISAYFGQEWGTVLMIAGIVATFAVSNKRYSVPARWGTFTVSMAILFGVMGALVGVGTLGHGLEWPRWLVVGMGLTFAAAGAGLILWIEDRKSSER